MIIENMFGEKRTLKYDKLFEVSSGFNCSELINAENSFEAKNTFLDFHPKCKNDIEIKEIEFYKSWNVNSIIES